LVAVTAVVGATVITIADAPKWEMESYLGLLGGLAGVAFISTINEPVGKALAALLLTALLLSRGEEALTTLTKATGTAPAAPGLNRRRNIT
jgi:uncharacterized membrane protein